MRKSFLAAVLAGSLSVGALWAQQQPNPNPAQNPGPAQLPAGVGPKELNDQEDIRDVLGSTVNAALTKGAFDDMAERFSTADRRRFGDFVKRDFPQLDVKIDQLRTAWQAKYGQELKLNNKDMVKSFYVVLEGEVTDPALAKMHWPVRAANPRSNEPIQASDSSSSAEYLDKGRNVAIVTVPTTGTGMQNLHISMIHENIDSWRIDVPDSITAEQIFNGVLASLTKFSDKMDAWPANVNDASRQLSHSILSAIYNVQMREGGQASVQPRP